MTTLSAENVIWLGLGKKKNVNFNQNISGHVRMGQLGLTTATDTTICTWQATFCFVPFGFVRLKTILRSELSFVVNDASVGHTDHSSFRFSFPRRLRSIQKSNYQLRHVCLSSAWKNSAHNGGIFMKFDIWVLFRESVENVQFSLKSDKNIGYFTSRPMHNFWLYLAQTKLCEKSKHTFHVQWHCSENTAVCDKMWETAGQPGKPQMTIQYGACALLTG
jgi:hypothetical protein